MVAISAAAIMERTRSEPRPPTTPTWPALMASKADLSNAKCRYQPEEQSGQHTQSSSKTEYAPIKRQISQIGKMVRTQSKKRTASPESQSDSGGAGQDSEQCALG